ncbi:MAG: zinc ribbon domain-containing protein [Rhodoluna sp.]|nr:zinc ribbon domain-containing protein [Rhodoluna sp.]
MSDNTFCTSCGTALAAGAGFCASCGSSTSSAPTAAPVTPQPVYATPSTGKPQLPIEARSKGTAVLLNVLFGFFGYLYTYKTDKVRFWLFFAILVVNFFVGTFVFVFWVFWIAPIIVSAMRSPNWYANYPNNVR